MLKILLTIGIVLAVLLMGEYLARVKRRPGELTRKFVHISVGSFVAFWPFFLSWRTIELFSLAFLAAVLISEQFHVFRAIHSVQRPTRGELFFALAVGAVALITHDKWIYMAAILQMSLADGLAAIVGTHWGRHHFYKIFGHTKSLIGTATFFAISLAILVFYSRAAGRSLLPGAFLGLTVLATAIENLAGQGLDNLLVPLLIACALRFL